MALCRFQRYLFQSGQPGGRWPLTHPSPAPEHRARYRSRPLLLSPPFLAQGDTSENMGMQRNDFSKSLRSCSCIEDDAWEGGRCAGRPLVPAVVAGYNGAGSISGSASLRQARAPPAMMGGWAALVPSGETWPSGDVDGRKARAPWSLTSGIPVLPSPPIPATSSICPLRASPPS